MRSRFLRLLRSEAQQLDLEVEQAEEYCGAESGAGFQTAQLVQRHGWKPRQDAECQPTRIALNDEYVSFVLVGGRKQYLGT